MSSICAWCGLSYNGGQIRWRLLPMTAPVVCTMEKTSSGTGWRSPGITSCRGRWLQEIGSGFITERACAVAGVCVCALDHEGDAEQAPAQLGFLRGSLTLSATRAPPASGFNVWTDKLNRGPLEESAEQARLKLTTRRDSGASQPSVIWRCSPPHRQFSPISGMMLVDVRIDLPKSGPAERQDAFSKTNRY